MKNILILVVSLVFYLEGSRDLQILPQMPNKYIEKKFTKFKEGYLNRWKNFEQNRTFTPFKVGRSDAELIEEFKNIQKIRYAIWYENPDEIIKVSNENYQVSEPLIFLDRVNIKNCIAFKYNNIVPYYNASLINLDNICCIALACPRFHEVNDFFSLIYEYHVTDLVRLTNPLDEKTGNVYAYWKGLVKDGLINIPIGNGITYPVRYYTLEEWRDDQPIDPEKLLKFILEVKKNSKFLAVHCVAGVGRAGTFIAALAIIDAIDKKIPFSIEEIVYRMSIQRIKSVAVSSQYIVLHRLAENYLKTK